MDLEYFNYESPYPEMILVKKNGQALRAVGKLWQRKLESAQRSASKDPAASKSRHSRHARNRYRIYITIAEP